MDADPIASRSNGVAASQAGHVQGVGPGPSVQPDETEAACRRILAAEPGDAEANYKLASLLAQRDALERAIPHFVTALRSDGRQPKYWLALAAALLVQNRLGEAKSLLAMFAKADFGGLDVGPIVAQLTDLLFAHACERHRARLIDEAELLYDAILMLDSAHAPSLHGAALVALARGRRDDAAVLLRLAIDRDDTAAAYHTDLARLLCDGGALAEALAHAERALALDPELLAAQIARLAALCGLGRTDEAIAAYRAATADDPDRFRGAQELQALVRRVRTDDLRASGSGAAHGAATGGGRRAKTRDAVFYVASPGYSYLSGGPLALHLLCHHLNGLGYEAYIHTNAVSGRLRTPVLTQAMREAHAASRRRRIGIYPEIDHSNRMGCDRVIRYLLNTPGARSAHSDEATQVFWNAPERRDDYIIHFAEEFQVPYLRSHPLWLPLVDGSVYHADTDQRPRRGFLVYSHRTAVTPDMIPDWAHPYTMVSMSHFRTPEELAELYRTSEALVVFERTGAIGEALLCGCPVVAVPSETFRDSPMFARVGNLGLGWGAGRDQLDWAKRSVEAIGNVHRAYDIAVPTEVRERIEAALDFFDDGVAWTP